MDEPTFNSPREAIEWNWKFTLGLCGIVGWLIIWLAHLTLALVIALAMWLAQVTPEATAQGALQLWRSAPVAVATAAGASLLTLLGVYWKLTRWAHREAVGGWMLKRLSGRA